MSCFRVSPSIHLLVYLLVQNDCSLSPFLDHGEAVCLHSVGTQNIFLTVPIWTIVYLVIQIFSLKLPFKTNSYPTKSATPAFVITIANDNQRLPIVVSLFRKYTDLNLSPFYAIDGNRRYPARKNQPLTPGERGLRETMKQFFAMTLERDYNEVFLFEDDAIPHLNFTHLFKRLPNRCQEADILLLGATMWLPKGETWPLEACFDARNSTYGAFAVLIKRSAFLPILTWLKTGPALPWDLAYGDLQRQNLTVRVAYPPFLVIADMSHTSSVNRHRKAVKFALDTRAKWQDWHFENYPAFSVPPEKAIA